MEPNSEQMKELIEKVSKFAIEHVATLPIQPSADKKGAKELALSLVERDLPEKGIPIDDLLRPLYEKYIPKSFNTASPGYLAYIPGGGIFHSALADLIANAANRYIGMSEPAPALAQLESNVVRWFNQMVGYSKDARGTLTSGGSISNFTGVYVARRTLLGDDFSSGTIYCSDQSHYCAKKAAMIAGIPVENVREIKCDSEFRIREDLLEQAIEKDKKEGKKPFLVIANAGTTNTGAIDRLDRISEICKRHSIWLHADAAYGGFFALTPFGKEALKGLDQCDSITLDPHKSLFLPYGTGAFLCKSGEKLLKAFQVKADYLPNSGLDEELWDFNEMSMELSRDFRGLRVWLPFKLLGVKVFREQLEEKRELALWATDELRQIPKMRIVAEPQLSLLAFRYEPEGLSQNEYNDLNRRLLGLTNDAKNVYLSGSEYNGEYFMRICVISFRTHREILEKGLRDIQLAIESTQK